MHKRIFLFLCFCWLMFWGYDQILPRLAPQPTAGVVNPTETTASPTETTVSPTETQPATNQTTPPEAPPIVEIDPDGNVVELGAIGSSQYPNNLTARYVWDVKIWGDLVYRAAGDYDKNSGSTPIWAFNKATNQWVVTGTADDEAIHRFIEIDGTLYTPGIDATEGWELGNFYVLEGETWKKVRNLPNGIHNFDMVEFDGKIFAGVGTETLENTVAVSQDKGASFTFVPLDWNGRDFDSAIYEYSRTYAFAEYDGQLYALLSFEKAVGTGSDKFIFRYEDGKMVYQVVADSTLIAKTGRNYWQGKAEWNGNFYIATTVLNVITDFSNPQTYRQISMPNSEIISDLLLYNDALYVLCFTFHEDMTSTVVIYQSATGEDGSFTEVTAFDYVGIPLSFDFDGEHFYIGCGSGQSEEANTGMLLRVRA